MSNYEMAKQIINENLKDGDCGLFNTRNLVGDPMDKIYDNGTLQIEICHAWSYFEVFGLSGDDFEKLHDWYDDAISKYREEQWGLGSYR